MYDFLMIVVGFFLILGLFIVLFSVLLPIFQRLLRLVVKLAKKCEIDDKMQNIIYGVGFIFLWCMLILYCFHHAKNTGKTWEDQNKDIVIEERGIK